MKESKMLTMMKKSTMIAMVLSMPVAYAGDSFKGSDGSVSTISPGGSQLSIDGWGKDAKCNTKTQEIQWDNVQKRWLCINNGAIKYVTED